MCVAECPVPVSRINWLADEPEKNNVGHQMLDVGKSIFSGMQSAKFHVKCLTVRIDVNHLQLFL